MTEPAKQGNKKRTLIVFYSRGGATRKAAKTLQKITHGKVFEIKGEKNYGNYFTALRIARKEFSENEFPKVVNQIKDFASYDRILIGFPIWYGKCPQLVLSFAAQYDFRGKEIFPFCTSGMSGPEPAVEMLADVCDGAVIHRGLRMNKVDDKTIKQWLKENA